MTLRQGRDGLALLDRTSPLQLLLIEDSLPDSDLVLAMLEDEFPLAEIQVETTLDAAMSQLALHRFDLVLADLSLPDADGAPVVRAVRSTRPETALMVLTGRTDGELALWALAEGAQDYLVKGQYDGPHLATALLHALQRQRAEAEAHRYLQLARGLMDALDAPTCAIDAASRIVAVNRAWREMTEQNGGSEDLCGVGISYLETCDRAATAGGDTSDPEAAIVAQGIRRLLAGTVDRFRHDYPCHSPTAKRWFNVRVTPAVINESRGAVITHLDITDLHQIQLSMDHRSLHDPLTDLPNRVLMRDRVAQAIGDADRRGLGVAVTHLDLHRYRRVNDSLGYGGGDKVLVQVAARLQEALDPGNTLARFAGDEFLVLWRDLGPDAHDEAVTLSQGLVQALDGEFHIGDLSVPVSAAAGVAWHVPGAGVDDLLQAATAATQFAKSHGPGHVVLFTDELKEATDFRSALETELRQALQEPVTQFVLHYQPIVDLTSGRVVAVEALVRWQHPVRGLLSPDRFIPLAEATELIHPLGEWVLHQAARDAATLADEGRELDIALNVSVQQLDDHMVELLRESLRSSGLRPGRLILEVTESAFVEDEVTTTSTLERLSALGVQIAIDDFGTGYCSLLYLRRYPIDTLKIDRAFVAGIGQSADDEAICGSITGLATAVGASSVGEGVETAEQYAALRSMGCRLGQGFLWSRAVPIHELDGALEACKRVPVPLPRSGKSLTGQANGVRWSGGAVARGLPSAPPSGDGRPPA